MKAYGQTSDRRLATQRGVEDRRTTPAHRLGPLRRGQRRLEARRWSYELSNVYQYTFVFERVLETGHRRCAARTSASSRT
jgi:hypothetical protein